MGGNDFKDDPEVYDGEPDETLRSRNGVGFNVQDDGADEPEDDE